MEKHSVNKKFSRLFPSSFTSCQFRNVSDVVENSIFISKSANNHVLGASSRTNSSIKTQESKSNKNDLKVSNKTYRPKEYSNVIKSSSSNGGWFSSEGENEFCGETEDALFSLSSGSLSESFRRKTAETHRSIYKSSEMSRCSSELSTSSLSTNGRVGSNMDKLKINVGVKSNLNESKVNGRVWSNLSESKWIKSINDYDFNTLKTGQNRAKTSHTTRKTAEKQTKSSGRTGRKTSMVKEVEKFDYYNDFNTHRKTTKSRRKIKKSSLTSSNKIGQFSIVVDGRNEESIAVEKNTSDPYNDFRTSMVEMIVEKQIFGVEDLQRLLHCFLSLNSPTFHKIIFEVFSEICETLFTNW